jgi:hypothetical protein
MTTETDRSSYLNRIGINVGAGYVPGINAVVMGAAVAAGQQGWEVVGIRDGFDGLLHPERYRIAVVEVLGAQAGGLRCRPAWPDRLERSSQPTQPEAQQRSDEEKVGQHAVPSSILSIACPTPADLSGGNARYPDGFLRKEKVSR